MKYLKYILTSVILFAMVSCDMFSDPDLPIPLDETMDNTGAFLRILDVETAGFDILEIQDAAFVFTGEYWDNEGQSLLDEIVFYSNYRAAEGQIPDVDRTMIKSYTLADFGENPDNGWPLKTFEISITEINAVLGIDEADNLLGDRYRIDWVLELTDGRSFSAEEMSPAITGGFFNSPGARNVDVVAQVPENMFVGPYEFTQLDPGDFGLVYSDATFTADLSIDPNNTLNGRVFQEEYLGALGFNVGPRDQPMVLALANDTDNNVATLSTIVGSGLACSALGLSIGPERENISQFDIEDDSGFTFGITENTEGDCGGAPSPVSFDVVKAN